LPTTIDLVFGLKGGSAQAAIYLFDEFLLADTGTAGDGAGAAPGTYQVTFLNNSGKNSPALSNMTMFARDGTTPPHSGPPAGIPAPGVLALVGIGLVGLGLLRRRPAA
jgi:hypothetical protein